MRNEILIEYLCTKSSIPVITLDNNNIILKCNTAFLNIIKEVSSPIGKSLEEILTITFLNNYEVFKNYTKQEISCTYQSKNGITTTLDGSKLEYSNEKFILFEKYLISEYDIIEQMSQMNIEMSTLTRELSKKNKELLNTYSELEKIVNTDYLTNIYNRKYFFERLIELVSLRKRTGTPNFGVIMIDIDFFKKINDTYGHDKGDVVLKSMTKLFNDNIRKEDVFARIGGEEFCLIARTDSKESLFTLANNLRKLCESYDFDGIDKRVTASFGATLYKDNETTDNLMKRVDNALYEAKDSGRNCVILI